MSELKYILRSQESKTTEFIKNLLSETVAIAGKKYVLENLEKIGVAALGSVRHKDDSFEIDFNSFETRLRDMVLI